MSNEASFNFTSPGTIDATLRAAALASGACQMSLFLPFHPVSIYEEGECPFAAAASWMQCNGIVPSLSERTNPLSRVERLHSEPRTCIPAGTNEPITDSSNHSANPRARQPKPRHAWGQGGSTWEKLWPPPQLSSVAQWHSGSLGVHSVLSDLRKEALSAPDVLPLAWY